MTQSNDETLLPVLRAALDQTRSATCITTADLDRPGPEIVYVNPAYCRMTGYAADEVIGQTPRIMQGPLTSRPVLDRLRADLEAGRPFVGETVNYRKDGRPFLISWRVDPVRRPDGTTTHYVATQEDITRLHRAERLLETEQAIDRTVSALLRQPAATSANLGALVAGIGSAMAKLVGYGQVSVAGTMRLGTGHEPFQSGPAAEQSIEASRTAGGYPAAGQCSGRFWLGCSLTSKRGGTDGAVVVADLDPAELDFIDRPGFQRATECARRALESLAEYERQRLVAIELQRNLLPETTPTVPGLEIATRYQPGAFAAQVGGDWYEVLQEGDRVVLVVGDMAGSGLRAAADMGRLRLLTKVLLQHRNAVSEVFASLNRFCAEEDLLATALAVTVNIDAGTGSIVSAGHLPPVARANRRAEIVELTPGPPLGIGGSPAYPERVLALDAGTTVVLFTDGLIERADESIDVSLCRLVEAVSSDEGDETDVSGLCNRLVDRRSTSEATDDIAVVTFRLVSST